MPHILTFKETPTMLATGSTTNCIYVRSLLSALLTLSVLASAQTPNSKLHATKGTTPHVAVDVDQPFTQEMGNNAGLDKDHPEFSTDGLHYGKDSEGHAVASTECLLSETIVAQKNSLSHDEVAKFCQTLGETGNVTIDSARSNLKEHGVEK
jgi:hypothetical protein